MPGSPTTAPSRVLDPTTAPMPDVAASIALSATSVLGRVTWSLEQVADFVARHPDSHRPPQPIGERVLQHDTD